MIWLDAMPKARRSLELNPHNDHAAEEIGRLSQPTPWVIGMMTPQMIDASLGLRV